MAKPERLVTFEFATLCFVSFFAFCNMSVFYSFYSYLGRIGVPGEWRGFLLGLEPMSAFALRLAVIPMVHAGNAARAMIIALMMTGAALISYSWAVTVPSLIVLRVFHGAAFVLLVSAVMALVVHFIPEEKSAQGFGIVSVSVLVPYAVMPILTEALLPRVRSEAQIYAGVTVLIIPAIILLSLLRRRLECPLDSAPASLMRRLSTAELKTNLKHRPVILILAVNLLFYLGYATVFYFVQAYFKSMEAGNAGHFFTIATAFMIGVRVCAGALFDKIDKIRWLTLFALLLALWFVLFGHVRSMYGLNLMAAYYGLCIGVILPMLNAAMFHVSPEQFRGLNANLSLFMMDSGFVLSSYAGGILIACGYAFQSIFYICSGLVVVAAVLLIDLGRQGKKV